MSCTASTVLVFIGKNVYVCFSLAKLQLYFELCKKIIIFTSIYTKCTPERECIYILV